MIASLEGRLAARGEDYLVLEVGGIGFKVHIPASLFSQLPGLGRDVRLHTYLQVRDNELALYGFASEEELGLFELLLGVNGVGPRTALSALSALRPEDLRRAVVQGDGELLRHIPGIGRKTAERIILDLKDKLGMEGGPTRGAPSVLDAEVVAALTTLGYSLAEAREAVGSLPAGELSLEEKVMWALRYLGKE